MARLDFKAGDYIRVKVKITDNNVHELYAVEGGVKLKIVLLGVEGEHAEFLAVADGYIEYDDVLFDVRKIKLVNITGV